MAKNTIFVVKVFFLEIISGEKYVAIILTLQSDKSKKKGFSRPGKEIYYIDFFNWVIT